jgi:hypothetical protein
MVKGIGIGYSFLPYYIFYISPREKELVMVKVARRRGWEMGHLNFALVLRSENHCLNVPLSLWLSWSYF